MNSHIPCDGTYPRVQMYILRNITDEQVMTLLEVHARKKMEEVQIHDYVYASEEAFHNWIRNAFINKGFIRLNVANLSLYHHDAEFHLCII